jgi:hypothetical protein
VSGAGGCLGDLDSPTEARQIEKTRKASGDLSNVHPYEAARSIEDRGVVAGVPMHSVDFIYDPARCEIDAKAGERGGVSE